MRNISGAAYEEARSRGGVHGFCAGNEGVILHSISCWSKNGASHRMNVDTPPLEGSCLVPSEPNGFPAKTKNLPEGGNLLVSRLWLRNEGFHAIESSRDT